MQLAFNLLQFSLASLFKVDDHPTMMLSDQLYFVLYLLSSVNSLTGSGS
jgi:hypothetical protein